MRKPSAERKAIQTLALAGITAVLGCSTAWAQIGIVRMDDFEQCRRAETMVELRLKSCTAVIEDISKIAEVRAEAYLNRGIAHEELGNIAAAIADYTEGLKFNPDYRMLYHRRGLAHDLDGKRDLAIADFSQAIRIDSKDVEALIYRGLSYAAEGDHSRAILDYDAALAEEPDDAAVLAIRGESREALGDRDRAIADYRKALELDPENDAAGEGLARLGAERR